MGLAVLLHVIDRVPAKEGEERLQGLLRVAPSEGKTINEEALAMWLETEETLMDQRDRINNLDIDESEKGTLLSLLLLPPVTLVLLLTRMCTKRLSRSRR